jgi:hypothetical protein
MRVEIQKDIARRIAAAQYTTPADQWPQVKLRILGESRAAVNAILRTATVKARKQIAKTTQEAATLNLAAEIKIIKSAGITPPVVK